jgi:hypothetical protein
MSQNCSTTRDLRNCTEPISMSQNQKMQDTRQARGVPRTLLAIVVIAIVLGAVAIGIAVGRNHSKSSTRGTITVNQACQNWIGTYRGSPKPPSDWCDSLAIWMYGRAHGGDSAILGSAVQMRAACTLWMSHNANANGNAWCDNMSQWMQSQANHSGGWRGWMIQPGF